MKNAGYIPFLIKGHFHTPADMKTEEILNKKQRICQEESERGNEWKNRIMSFISRN